MSSYRPPEVERIREEVRRLNDLKIKAGEHGRVYDQNPDTNFLRVKKAGDWMKLEQDTPDLKKLFGGFWYEGELCILFADTNLGKSVLAVQIADSLTKLYQIGHLENEATKPPTVLYVDFELNSRQFEARYTERLWGSYPFADSFYRAECNPSAYEPYYHQNYEQYVNDSITSAISQSGARILIIDNITYMCRGTERSGAALALMKALKEMKIKYKLSVLVLAHTPKRKPGKPLTVNDLQGSKMLINFADSAFAIGQSQADKHLRYLKQIKQRNQQESYGADNVCLIRQEKEHNFLKFKFEGYARERDHLGTTAGMEREARNEHIRQLHKTGVTLREIAAEMGLSLANVGRIVRGE